MKIGIIGAGNMGSALGKNWSFKGHEVMFSYSRNPEALKQLGKFNGQTSVGSIVEAISFGDVVMLAVPYTQLSEIFAHAELFGDKIVITCVSGLVPDFNGETIGLATHLKTSVAEQISSTLFNAFVVEAFNTTFAEVINTVRVNPPATTPSVFYCGDDDMSKVTVRQLIADAGFEPVDAGLLKVARVIETFATSWVQLSVVSKKFPAIGLKAIQL